MATESCIGCSNRCVHAHRPAAAVLVCLLGPPRQHSAGLSRASRAALHRLLLLTGTQRLARAALRGCRDVLLRCLSGCGSSSVRLAGLCLCADAPRAVASVCWPQTGRLLVSHGSKNKGCPSVFPHRPAASPAHPAAQTCRTHSAVMPTRSRAHKAANTQPSAVRRRAAMPCSPFFAQSTRAALSSTSIPSGTKDSFQQISDHLPDACIEDALPHASLAVILTAC